MEGAVDMAGRKAANSADRILSTGPSNRKGAVWIIVKLATQQSSFAIDHC